MVYLKAIILSLLCASIAIAQASARLPQAPLDHQALHDFARKVSVQIVVVDSKNRPNERGSGVWISERYVATCEHVIHALGSNYIFIGFPQQGGYYDKQTENSMTGFVLQLSAKVVYTDEVADVAILELADPMQAAAEGLPITFTKVSTALPEIGTDTVLAGLPFGASDLVTQLGNVAGFAPIEVITHDDAWVERWERETSRFPRMQDQSKIQKLTADTMRLQRVLLSVASNPGDSGGPVFDQDGLLIGLLEGNQSIPARRSDGSRQIVMVPVAVAGLIVGVDGRSEAESDFIAQADSTFQPRLVPSYVFENTGISYLVPAAAVANTMRRCELERKCDTGPLPYVLGHFGSTP